MPQQRTPEPIVLVGDDHDASRRLVGAILEPRHYRLIAATNGDEALRLAREHRPTIAILDIHMPGLNGIEVAQAIKADPALSGTKIIFLTGLVNPGIEQNAMAAGGDYYLTKPFSPLQLLKLIDQLMGEAD